MRFVRQIPRCWAAHQLSSLREEEALLRQLGAFPGARERTARGSVSQADNGAASFRLDVRRPDHLGPLLGFLGDELAEVSGRPREHGATQVGEACLHRWIGEGGVDLAIELVDDLSWRISWCCDAI